MLCKDPHAHDAVYSQRKIDKRLDDFKFRELLTRDMYHCCTIDMYVLGDWVQEWTE